MTSPHPLLNRRLLLLTAHPDDEAVLAAALTWQNHRHGGTTAVICATLGEKGTSHLKRPMSAAKLKIVRRKEMVAGAKIMKMSRVFFLGLPDGGVDQKLSRLFRLAQKHIMAWNPDVLVTFGPDGITGHRDHIACWRVGRRLSKELHLPLFIFTVPPSLSTKTAGWFMKRRANPHYHPIAPYKKPTVRIPAPRGFKQKVLRRYPTQMNPNNPYQMPMYAVKKFAAAEYFAKVKI